MEADPPLVLRAHSPTLVWLWLLVRLSAVRVWFTSTLPVSSAGSPLTDFTHLSTASLMVSVPPVSSLIVSPALPCRFLIALLFSVSTVVSAASFSATVTVLPVVIGISSALFPPASEIAWLIVGAPASALTRISEPVFPSTASIFALIVVLSVPLIGMSVPSIRMRPWLSAS